MSTQDETITVIADLTSNKAGHYQLACMCGNFSATRGDYFQRDQNKVMHCAECDMDLILEQRIWIRGETSDGKYFRGHGWMQIQVSVIPPELPD